MKITEITVHVTRDTPHGSRVSLTDPPGGDPGWVVAVRVTTDGPTVGIGYTTSAVGGPALRSLIAEDLVPTLIGEDPRFPERLFQRLVDRLGEANRAEILRAWSAVDLALWDLRIQSVGLSAAEYWGAMRGEVRCFVADLADRRCDPGTVVRTVNRLITEGVAGIAVEVGGGDPQDDADRVQAIRDGVGESAWLGIIADGRYDFATAMAMAHFFEDDIGIDWFDTPIPIDDHHGYQRMAERMESTLVGGSSLTTVDQFRDLLQHGRIRVLRPDIGRIGGITPFLKIAALSSAYRVPMVPRGHAEIAPALACGLGNIPMVELRLRPTTGVTGSAVLEKGRLRPGREPGLGLKLAADRFGS